MVAADLDGAFAHEGHVAVGAGDPTAGVDALAPEFELGVLGFEDLGTAVGVFPVDVAGFIVPCLHLLDFESVVPGVGEFAFGAFEVVLDVALGADEGAFLLA